MSREEQLELALKELLGFATRNLARAKKARIQDWGGWSVTCSKPESTKLSASTTSSKIAWHRRSDDSQACTVCHLRGVHYTASS